MDADKSNRHLGDFAKVDTADAQNLVARLDAMHDLDSFQTYKRETFNLLRVAPGARVADIGCGTGEDARKLAGLTGEAGETVGYDLSEAMLEQARSRHADVPGLSFMLASTEAIPAPDDTFDGVRVDRVLIHVQDATQALSEMIRVTRPGGRIVVAEPDMPGCWVCSSDYTLTAKVMDEIARSCARPYLARDLWTMFTDAGLTDVSLEVRPVTVFNPASVGTILDFGSVLAGMLKRNEVTAEEVAGWVADFEERGHSKRFAAGVSIFVASGTKR